MALQLHTRNVTDGEDFNLDGDEGVLLLSYKMSNGAGDNATLTGNVPFKAASDNAAVNSEPITLGPGDGNVFVSDATQKAIELEINVVQGTMAIIVGF